MIEAAEYATPLQLEQHKHWQESRRRFFPKPPVIPMMHEAALIAPPPPEPAPPPEPPPAPKIAAKLIGLEQTKARMKVIRRCICAEFEVSLERLMGTQRAPEYVLPRHVYSYMASRLTKASLPMIARSLSNDHTTILHAIRKISRLVSLDGDFADRLIRLESSIRAELGEVPKPTHSIARYVEHRRIHEFEDVGWYWVAHLNEYACLMLWPCACRCVEPKG